MSEIEKYYNTKSEYYKSYNVEDILERIFVEWLHCVGDIEDYPFWDSKGINYNEKYLEYDSPIEFICDMAHSASLEYMLSHGGIITSKCIEKLFGGSILQEGVDEENVIECIQIIKKYNFKPKISKDKYDYFYKTYSQFECYEAVKYLESLSI